MDSCWIYENGFKNKNLYNEDNLFIHFYEGNFYL